MQPQRRALSVLVAVVALCTFLNFSEISLPAIAHRSLPKCSERCNATCLKQRRHACVARLEPLRRTELTDETRGQWNRWLLRSIVQGLSHCPNAAVSQCRPDPRRLYIDVGSAAFGSSVNTFVHWYEGGLNFTVHAFEVANVSHTFELDSRKLFLLDSHQRRQSHLAKRAKRRNERYIATEFRFSDYGPVHFHRMAVTNHTGFVSFLRGSRGQHLAEYLRDGQLNSASSTMVSHRTMRDHPRDAFLTLPSVSLCDFFKKEKISVYDYVVLKIDVEGGEWAILYDIQRCGLADLVDELLLECHDGSMGSTFVGVNVSHCVAALERLRRDGVLAHQWI